MASDVGLKNETTKGMVISVSEPKLAMVSERSVVLDFRLLGRSLSGLGLFGKTSARLLMA